MRKRIEGIIFLVFSLIVGYEPGFCLDGKDIIRLSDAGINEETIQVIVKEKVIETCSLTIEEIINLKKAGMNEKTIQMIIENASSMKDTETIEYGKEIKPLKYTTIPEIITLKNSGISDEVILAIIAATRSEDDIERKKAWDMLNSLGIILDERPNK